MKLVGWISFTRKLLWQQRKQDELEARKKIGPAAVESPGAPDTRRT